MFIHTCCLFVALKDNSNDIKTPSSRRASRENIGDVNKPVFVTPPPDDNRPAADPNDLANSSPGPPPKPSGL